MNELDNIIVFQKSVSNFSKNFFGVLEGICLDILE